MDDFLYHGSVLTIEVQRRAASCLQRLSRTGFLLEPIGLEVIVPHYESCRATCELLNPRPQRSPCGSALLIRPMRSQERQLSSVGPWNAG
jgi:hypothetical protein